MANSTALVYCVRTTENSFVEMSARDVAAMLDAGYKLEIVILRAAPHWYR